jgi:hypothetical protein
MIFNVLYAREWQGCDLLDGLFDIFRTRNLFGQGNDRNSMRFFFTPNTLSFLHIPRRWTQITINSSKNSRALILTALLNLQGELASVTILKRYLNRFLGEEFYIVQLVRLQIKLESITKANRQSETKRS